MGVKWTCALVFFLGIAYLSVEATSARDGIAKIRNRRGLDDSFADSPMQKEKREVKHYVHDDGKGTHFEGVSSTNENGASFSGTWSNKNGGGGGGGGGSWISSGPGIVTRSGFDDSGNAGTSASSSSTSGASTFGAGTFPSSGFPGQNFGGFGNFQNFGPPNVGSYPYYPNRNSAFYQPPIFNYQDFIQEHLRQIQAQHEEFQSRFRGPNQPWVKTGSDAWAHAGAFITSPNGGVQPNPRAHSYSWSSTPTGSMADFNRGAGHSGQQSTASNQAVNNRQRYFGQNNGLGYGSPFNNYIPNQFDYHSRGGFGNDFGKFGGFNRGFPHSSGEEFSNSFHQHQGGNVAQASASIGPQGGFQTAEISPASPGVESRFAEEVPPPSSGKSYSTHTSSSSRTYRGPDGKVKTEKVATTRINDNGKVSTHTVHDP